MKLAPKRLFRTYDYPPLNRTRNKIQRGTGLVQSNLTCYLDDRLCIEFKRLENINIFCCYEICYGGCLHNWLINAFNKNPITGWDSVYFNFVPIQNIFYSHILNQSWTAIHSKHTSGTSEIWIPHFNLCPGFSIQLIKQ